MKYISTRNSSKEYSFEEVFVKGLADDGGLFVPKSLKKFKNEELISMSKLNYQNLPKKLYTHLLEILCLKMNCQS